MPTATWAQLIDPRDHAKQIAREHVSKHPNPTGDPSDSFLRMCATITIAAEQSLAAMPYREFLGTYYWGVVREFVLYVRNNECVLCESPHNPQLHHRHYRNRGREWVYWERDLVILCGRCHAKFHAKA